MRRRRRHFWLGAVGVALLAMGLSVAVFWRQLGGHHPLEIASWIATVLGLLFSVASWWPSRPTAAGSLSQPEQLDKALKMLASEVGRQWREEAHARGLPVGVFRGQDVRWSLDGSEAPSSDVAELVALVRAESVPRIAILGDAGSGKTSLAVLLTIGLTDTSDHVAPVPVLLPAADWVTDSALEEWLLVQLRRQYTAFGNEHELGETAIRELLRSRQVLPILDGLDEMPPPRRADAASALERLRGDSPYILICRTAEFWETFPDARRSMRTIEMVPLDPSTTIGYLAERGRWSPAQRQPLLDRLAAEGPDGPLGEALATPLFGFLADIYLNDGGHRAAALAELADVNRLPTAEAIQGQLLRQFVPTIYRANAERDDEQAWERDSPRARRDNLPRRWDPVKSLRWLSLLADSLARDGRTSYEWWEQHPRIPRSLLSPPQAPTRRALGWRKTSMSETADAVSAVLWWTVLAPVGLLVMVPRSASEAVGWPVVGRLCRMISAFYGRHITPVAHDLYREFDGYASHLGGRIPVLAVLLVLLVAASVARTNVTVDAKVDTSTVVSPADLLRTARGLALWRTGLVAVGSAVAGTGLALIYDAVTDALVNDHVIPWAPQPTVWLLIPVEIAVVVVTLGTTAWGYFVQVRVILAVTRQTPLRLMTFLTDAATLGALRNTGGAFQFRHIMLAQQLADQIRTAKMGRHRAVATIDVQGSGVRDF